MNGRKHLGRKLMLKIWMLNARNSARRSEVKGNPKF
jgi:hypothetical protein